MNKIIAILSICFLFVSCSPATPEVTQTITSTDTPIPTNTLEPTATATPIPLEGILFFDMNGSGLRDQATFTYDTERLADEAQPLQPDLLATFEAYVVGNPELKDGDLITLEEPGLSGYTICAKSNCVTTDAEGKFQLVEPDVDRFLNISIKDPNEGTPALEMRYINKWSGQVVVPEYTKDVDASIMGQLKAVPACEANPAALVCKQDEDTLLVREQHLNNTSILKLGEGATLQPSNPNEIGLMQGVLTLPFIASNILNPIIWNGFDIFGVPNSRDGIVSNFRGTISPGNPFIPESGQLDSHSGLDFVTPVGTYSVASMGGSVNNGMRKDNEIMLFLTNSILGLWSNYGHLAITFQNLDGENTLRGQIIALTGNSGDNNLYFGGSKVSQLHWDIAKIPGDNLYIDPFATIIPLKEGVKFSGSTNSMWTVYNLPMFP